MHMHKTVIVFHTVTYVTVHDCMAVLVYSYQAGATAMETTKTFK